MNDSSATNGQGGQGFDWSSLMGALPGLVSTGTGLYDLFSKSPTSAQGSITAGAQAADPFGGQRAQYQPMLQKLMTNPGELTPQGQASLQQGLQAMERSEAAKGMLGSGNLLQALTQYGTQVAEQDYNNQFNQLAQLSGVNSGSPASAGQILAGRYNQRNGALANIGGGLASLTGQGQPGGGGAMGNLSNLYSLYSKMNGGNSPISNLTSSLKDYFGGSGSATTGGSELGAGNGGGFDQWAATQPGMEAGSGIGAGETASTYDALGSDAGGYGGWGAGASDAGSFGTAGSEAASASAGEASAAGAEGGAAGAGSGLLAAAPFLMAAAPFLLMNDDPEKTPKQVADTLSGSLGGESGLYASMLQTAQDPNKAALGGAAISPVQIQQMYQNGELTRRFGKAKADSLYQTLTAAGPFSSFR